jgi:hypothetical protein
VWFISEHYHQIQIKFFGLFDWFGLLFLLRLLDLLLNVVQLEVLREHLAELFPLIEGKEIRLETQTQCEVLSLARLLEEFSHAGQVTF